jgi:hypothetical protein
MRNCHGSAPRLRQQPNGLQPPESDGSRTAMGALGWLAIASRAGIPALARVPAGLHALSSPCLPALARRDTTLVLASGHAFAESTITEVFLHQGSEVPPLQLLISPHRQLSVWGRGRVKDQSTRNPRGHRILPAILIVDSGSIKSRLCARPNEHGVF